MIKPTLVALSLFPATAIAHEFNTESSSESNSGVYIGGTTVGKNTPSAHSSTTNSTAPCVVGKGFGISGPGLGISSSNGRIDDTCETLEEAKALRSLINDRAAITHLCRHNKDIRETLVGLGLCIIKKK